MWLEPMLLPHPLHRRMPHTELRGQHACAPMRSVRWLLIGGMGHDLEPHRSADALLAGAWTLALVLAQTLDAASDIRVLPAPHRWFERASRMIAWVPTPHPDSSTILARLTIFCGVLPSATSRSSVVRSLGPTYRHASMSLMPRQYTDLRNQGIL